MLQPASRSKNEHKVPRSRSKKHPTTNAHQDGIYSLHTQEARLDKVKVRGYLVAASAMAALASIVGLVAAFLEDQTQPTCTYGVFSLTPLARAHF